ncbi:hypothetical protein [Candidatus Epulonipiscium viviparus]|uniref:hypothetical protein n=1 Tax=Candidatus Epulonipiscium viviparus TaxID=420336 RepID=UPI0027380BC7|nr:hypothetical protein [Candidatus Epulopiscium viviparus]
MAKIKNQAYAQTGDFFTPIAEVTNTLEKLGTSPILIKKESSITDGETVVAGSPASYIITITHSNAKPASEITFDLTDALPDFFELDKTREITVKVGDADQPFTVAQGTPDEANNYTPYTLKNLILPQAAEEVVITIPVIVAGTTGDLLPEAPVFGNSEIAE